MNPYIISEKPSIKRTVGFLVNERKSESPVSEKTVNNDAYRISAPFTKPSL
jgi:hypothetical protein